MPVCVAKMRPNKEIEPRSDSIGTEKALERVPGLALGEFQIGQIGAETQANA
jgi:hypothetical protein